MTCLMLSASFYNPKYDWMLRRNSKTTNDFPYLKGTGCPPSVIMFISTVSKFFFCSGMYSIGLNVSCTFPYFFLGLSTMRSSSAFVSPTVTCSSTSQNMYTEFTSPSFGENLRLVLALLWSYATSASAPSISAKLSLNQIDKTVSKSSVNAISI